MDPYLYLLSDGIIIIIIIIIPLIFPSSFKFKFGKIL